MRIFYFPTLISIYLLPSLLEDARLNIGGSFLFVLALILLLSIGLRINIKPATVAQDEAA